MRIDRVIEELQEHVLDRGNIPLYVKEGGSWVEAGIRLGNVGNMLVVKVGDENTIHKPEFGNKRDAS